MAGGNVITSFIDGRIRIRDEKLKSISVVSHIQRTLSQFKGITDVSINRRSRSLLILYDKTILKLEQLLHVLADYLDAAKTECRKYVVSLTDRKIVNLAMLASLAVSMFGAAIDIAAVHIAGGIVFLGFLGLHFFRYKNILFA